MLASPRFRRRLGWLAVLVGVAVGTAMLVTHLPGKNPALEEETFAPSSPTSAAPEQAPKRIRLRRVDRRQIDELLERFVPAAVARRSPAAAYDLVTPALRAGLTRKDWARGNIPVYPYPARPGSHRGWRVNYAFEDDVSLELLIPPRRTANIGPVAFTVNVMRIRGRWLVDSIVPVSTFAPLNGPPKVTALPDFAPSESRATGTNRGRLSPIVLLAPFAAFGLILLGTLAAILSGWWRDRAPRERAPLPPLVRRTGA